MTHCDTLRPALAYQNYSEILNIIEFAYFGDFLRAFVPLWLSCVNNVFSVPGLNFRFSKIELNYPIYIMLFDDYLKQSIFL